ncbi:hypothetical protein [Streptomyces ossamyceticus]|uniref:hypothetical protein n=1 Tax=Streptomyces ossamyceticus TaxID=249581 RepID=UPI0006E2093B|nr:hypothetical protein [Streptomyces ossamyceticus]
MTPEQRRALLGDEVIARIHEEVEAAARDFESAPPEVRAEVIRRLRPILAPAAARLQARRAAEVNAT